MKKKLFALLLAALMVVTVLPMTAFAATVTFNTEYSMKNAAGEPNAIKWKLTKQKGTEFTLEIYGTGAIPKMMPSSYPWYSTSAGTNTNIYLKHLIIGENITNLPDFYGESSSTSKFAALTDIVINSKHFDADLDSTMLGQKNITTVTFSEGVESISFPAANTFTSCTSLATLNLPASLKSFNYHSQTFANDTAFKTITLGEGNKNFSLVDNVLYNKDKTELILAPTGLTVTPVSTVQRIAAGQNIDAKAMFSAQALNENIQITLKHNKDGKTPDNNVFYVGEMIKADVTAKEGGLPDGLFYAWLGMNGNGTAIDNANTAKIAGFETPDTFLDGSEFLMSPDALYGAVKITYFPSNDTAYTGTANCRFAVCKVIEDKITVIAYKDFIAKADSSAYSYDKAIKYIVNDLTAIMVKGETRTVQELLGRSGVTHITCYTVSISNVINKNSSEKISVSNNSITAVDVGEEIPVGFDIAIGNGGVCLYHNHTGSDPQKTTKITNNTFKIRVIDEPQFDVTGSQIIVTNPIPDCDYYIGQTKGVFKDGKVYFNNLNSDTEYAVTLQIADQSGATYTYSANTRTAVPTFYAITNGTPEIAKETNHGYITIDKATAAEGETVTVTVNPADGYQLKSLTVTPAAPTEYTVTFDLNGITGTAPTAQKIKYGGKVNKPADPTADGYTFGGWYKEATCTNAWDFANDTVTANTTLYAKWKPEDEGSYILKAQGNWFKAFSGTTTDKTKITDITFCKELPQGVSAENPVNLTDDEEKGKVKGYIVKNGENYKIYIVGDYIFGNADCQKMFKDFSNLKTLDFGNFDTSNVTLMVNMFDGCSNLTSFNLSSFNTSKVTYMNNMFYGCSNLTSLDLSSFDTSATLGMPSMFTGCSKLESITFGTNFNTSKVTTMVSMFNGCSALKSLDLSKFDTSAVTKMGSMFSGCSALKSLDLSKFNTKIVTDMPSMFNGCSGLTSLNLSSFDTSAVKDMNGMFTDCSKLESITFGTNFNTSKVTAMNAMFNGCSALKSLDLSSFDTSAVTNMDAMFKNCAALESLDLSSFVTPKVTKMSKMFNGCSTFERLDISNFTVGNGTTVDDMFKDCSELTSVKIISDENEKIKNVLGDGWTYNGETKAYEKAPANKLLKSLSSKLLKSPAPAVPETITPAKQTDGTYQFTMPAKGVTVTAEFEKIPHTHSFTYTANDNKITATCTAGCDKGYDTTPLTLTLTAPASLVYDGNAKAFTFADGEATAWTGAGLELPTFEYYLDKPETPWLDGLDGDPIAAAEGYVVMIRVGAKAAQVEFNIDKATPYIKTTPAPNDIEYGKKLSDSTLFGGYVQVSSTNTTQVGGLFEWKLGDTIPALSDSETTEYDVTFTPADTNNYNTVSCKVKIKVTHTHNPVKVTGQAATETAAGWKDYYKCDCGALFEDKNGTTPIENLNAWKAQGGKGYIAPLVHSITLVNGKNATDTEAGYKPYHECKNCNKYYEDAAGLIEIPDINAWKAKGGAGYLAPLHGTDNDHDHICDYCDRTVSNHIDADNNHICDYCNGQVSEHKGVLVEGTAATLESAGFKSYYKCDCGKFFEDANCKVEITDLAKWKAQGGNGYIAKLEEEPKSPETGDTSNMTLWVMLLALSSMGLCACLVLGKKRKNVQ